MPYVLGIDLGTSSMKGVLINEMGELVDTVSEPYAVSNPSSGYSEQNPEDWIIACHYILKNLAIRNVDFNKNLVGISFSGQMHSLVLADSDFNILRPAILWNDVRNTTQCEQIMNEFSEEILEITRNIALEGFTLPKILWVQQNEPEIWKKTEHIFLPKDYLRYKLTGKCHMDFSDASGTLLLDANKKKWSKKILEKYNIRHSILPKLVESTDYVGDLLESYKEKYNFKNNIKIFAGGADNACAALGAGMIDENESMVSIGTSGVFLSPEGKAHSNYNGKVHLFNHVIPGLSYSMGVTLAAGNSLQWFKKCFFKNAKYEEILEGASKIEPGANGLLFTPYIVGERTPHVDSTVRGSFVGIDIAHTINHFSRAVIEGITFSLKESQELIETETKKSLNKIVSLGGGAKSKYWQHIQADIFNSEIITLTVEEGPGYGAAMIAAVGAGWFNSLEECAHKLVCYNSPISPNQKNVEFYKKIFQIYKSIYHKTCDISTKLIEIKEN
ncbi:xylulokinase [Allofustis seminis]|uniref:xylulokinase n=1 Tax=Allofustis seminis TaxID=166939 RepID=UPI00036F2524|nr:xylulokinase [Allofustis seminis]